MGERNGRRLRHRAFAAVVVASVVGGAALVAPTGAHALITGELAAADDTYSMTFTTAGTALNVAAPGLLANDSGPTGTVVDIVQSDPTSFNGATVFVHANGSFTYKPDRTHPFTGEDTFTYWVKDLDGNEDFANVTIVVKPYLPVALYATNPNTTLTVKAPGVFTNDLGIDRTDALSSADSLTIRHGSVTVNNDGSFKYVPPHGFQGYDSFTYQVWDIDADDLYTATVRIHVAFPPPPPAKPKGYWMVGATGIVYAFGQVTNHGNAPSSGITHLEPTPSRHGYWVVNSAGQVFAFGDAKVYGGVPGLKAGEIVSSLSTTPSGKGYWLFTNRGKVIARGDAKFYGDERAVALNGPIVGSVATPTGHGYYMVGSDGGIFSFGDAKFHGSMGGAHLNQPINGVVPTASNHGYWLVASDGGIFNFGDARFRGSMGGKSLNRPVIGMVRYGNGYLMVASDGGIFSFSNLAFLGSLGSTPTPAPIVGVGAAG